MKAASIRGKAAAVLAVALAMAVVLAVSLTFAAPRAWAGPVTQAYDAAPWDEGGSYEADLRLDESVPVSTDSIGVFYRFVPEESGAYRFYSSDNGGDDTYGELYDAHGNLLSSDDDSGGYPNFAITRNLDAGTTYYLCARGYNGAASFSVTVSAYVYQGGPVNMQDVNLSYSFSRWLFEYTGEPIEPQVTLYYEGELLVEGADYVVSYYDKDEWDSYSSVKEPLDGPPIEAGKYYIVFIGKSGSDNNLSMLFTIVDPYNLSTNAGVGVYYGALYAGGDLDGLKINVDYYVRAEREPNVLFEPFYGSITLIEGADYEVTGYERLADDDWVRATDFNTPGKYRAVVEGLNPYHGVVRSPEFEIKAYDPSGQTGSNSLANASVIRNNKPSVRDGITTMPEWTLQMGDDDLVEGVDYTVAYYIDDDDEIADTPETLLGVGKYVAVFSPTANSSYTGTRSYYFTVYDAMDLSRASVQLGKRVYISTGEPVVLEDIRVTAVDGVELVQGVDFEFVFLYGDAFQDTDEWPIWAGKYGVGVKAAEGSDYTGKSNSYWTFKIASVNDLADGEFKLTKSNYEATGKPVVLDVEYARAADGTNLVLGTDYELVFYDYDLNELPSVPSKAGVYIVRFKGIGSYTGKSTHLIAIYNPHIEPISIAEATVTAESQVYAGAALTPEVTVVLDGTVVPASGYAVEYANNTNAGTATVIVSGIGDYTGTASGSFEIEPKAVTVSANAASKVYGEVDPVFVGTVEGTLGNDSVDYAIARVAGEDVGTYEITASGNAEQGNYNVVFTGGTFTINAQTITHGVVNGISDKSYTGSAITQSPTLTVGGIELFAGTDYAVFYKDNVNIGEATVTFTGKGNYTGTVSAKFQIDKGINPITATAKPIAIKAKVLKKGAQTIATKKAFTVKKAEGGVTYKVATYDKKAKKKITVTKAGKVKVKKGLKKGTYKLKVKVTAAGNAKYKALTKTVTLKVKVK